MTDYLSETAAATGPPAGSVPPETPMPTGTAAGQPAGGGTQTVPVSSSGWVNPVTGSPIPQGSNLFGVPRTGHTHQGVDLNAPGWRGASGYGAGTPVRAAGAGTVRYSTSTNGGWILHVVHDDGWVTKYMHLGSKDGAVKPYAVSNNSRVEAGQIIGYMGDSGNPETGAYHLHFEMWNGGEPVDPMTTDLFGPSSRTVTVTDPFTGQPVPDSDADRANLRRLVAGFANRMSREVAGGQRLSYEDVVRARQVYEKPDETKDGV